jgi:tetratricopeptide (TPR) repeat protein
MLSTSLEFEGKFDEAIEAARRMVSLTSDPTLVANLARTYIIARRFHEADSLIDVLKARTDQGHAFALDLAVTMSRERGDFRRAAALSDATVHSIGLDLLQGDNLARLGRIAKARKWFEASGHLEAPREIEAFNAPQARAFAWAHALEGDALWRAGDTVAVHALADSVRVVGARSYYGRDWVLYHHLNGLLALSRRDTATAERELTAARYGVAGWTATIAWLARIRIAHGDGDAAVALLRDAYKSPLDAMGRYVTRADLDELMVRAFERAGKADSARVYAARVSDAKR